MLKIVYFILENGASSDKIRIRTINPCEAPQVTSNSHSRNNNQTAAIVGVDVLDQMARYHTSKSSTRRWSEAVFFNILDCSCINAYIIYCLTTKLKSSRRQFMQELKKRTLQTKRWSGLNTSFWITLSVDYIVSSGSHSQYQKQGHTKSSGSHSQHCIAGNQWFSTPRSEKKRMPVCSIKKQI